VKQRWSHNLYTQNTYNFFSGNNTMPSTRKSVWKNLGMRPNFYGTDGDQDHVEITRGKVRAKQPSKKKPRQKETIDRHQPEKTEEGSD